MKWTREVGEMDGSHPAFNDSDGMNELRNCEEREKGELEELEVGNDEEYHVELVRESSRHHRRTLCSVSGAM